MTGHRIEKDGTLVTVPVPVAHAAEQVLRGHHGWFDNPDVVIFEQTFAGKWLHQYLVTGTIGGIGILHSPAQPRTYYVKVNGTEVWTVGVGAGQDGGAWNALVMGPVPLLALFTAPDDRDIHLVVGMTRSGDQDWEAAEGVHNVQVIDLGALA